MTVAEKKIQSGYLKGSKAPRCANCYDSQIIVGMHCSKFGFAVKPDGWCPSHNDKQTRKENQQ